MAGQDLRSAARAPSPRRMPAAPRGCTQKQRVEWLKCRRSPGYFLDTYGQVYDATPPSSGTQPGGELSVGLGGWAPFRLWPVQRRISRILLRRRLVVVLKARQLGLSWLVTGFALWLMLFRPASTVLLFSKRDDEAVHLLAFRLKGMYTHLPDWMRCRACLKDNEHEIRLSNGSAALAFPTTGGRSYTASLVLVDEADFAPNLEALMNAVKPTVDAGGRLVLISTADKSRPQSAFKRIYRAGREGGAAGLPDGWAAVFLPWSARPDRTAQWYVTQTKDVLARTGSLDDLWQEYPASDFEALAGRSLDKRFAPEWIRQCSTDGPSNEGGCAIVRRPRGRTSPESAHRMNEWPPPRAGPALRTTNSANEEGTAQQTARAALPGGLAIPGSPALPGLAVHLEPASGRFYAIGADPAEGNPQSDESAASVVDVDTGEQVAVLAGRLEPSVFAAHLAALSEYYNGAPVLVERNNHGHAVLLWLREFSGVPCLVGLDGKTGWLQTGKGKALCLDNLADCLRDGATRIRDTVTRDQLAGIVGSTLKAPEGEHDDRALAHALAMAALRWGAVGTVSPGVNIRPLDVIAEADSGGWR